jgi:hypothetical protein
MVTMARHQCSLNAHKRDMAMVSLQRVRTMSVEGCSFDGDKG